MKVLDASSRAVWGAVERLTATKRALIGTSLMRASIGAALTYHYLIHHSGRAFLFGPEGVIPWKDFKATIDGSESFSFYGVFSTNLWFEVVYHAGLLAAVALMLGWRPRLMAAVNFAFIWSLWERNNVLLDGGDNLVILLLVFLALVDSGHHLSVRRRRGRERSELRVRFDNLAHNTGVLCILLQICVLYMGSALFKAQGELWQNGTALYYAMRTDEFRLPGVSDLIYENPYFVVLMTYGTVLFQVSFAALLLSSKGRLIAFVIGFSLHSGIALLMGLLAFSWMIISAELVMIEDRHYRWVAAKLRKLANGRWGRRVPLPRRASATAMAADQARSR